VTRGRPAVTPARPAAPHAGTIGNGRRRQHLAGGSGAATTRLQRAWTRVRKAAALLAALIGDIAVGPVPPAPADRGNQVTAARFPGQGIICGRAARRGRVHGPGDAPAAGRMHRPRCRRPARHAGTDAHRPPDAGRGPQEARP
jgi:hypothetical protein